MLPLSVGCEKERRKNQDAGLIQQQRHLITQAESFRFLKNSLRTQDNEVVLAVEGEGPALCNATAVLRELGRGHAVDGEPVVMRMWK